MECLYPITIRNPRYRNMSNFELTNYCREHYLHEMACTVEYKKDVVTGELSKCLFPPDFLLVVPCGKCPNCRRNLRAGWVGRLLVEIDESRKQGFRPIFATFTFDPEHECATTKDCYTALRRFMDRFRKKYGYRPRYFFATEVSEKGRLHMHGIIFNGSKFGATYDSIRDCWTEGFCWLEECSEKKARYTCKYIAKDFTKDYPDGSPEKYKTRVFTANGVGLNYAKAHHLSFLAEDTMLENCIIIGGSRYPIHPYIKSKLYSDDVKIKLRIRRLARPVLPIRSCGRSFYSYADYLDFINERRRCSDYKPPVFVDRENFYKDALLNKGSYSCSATDFSTLCPPDTDVYDVDDEFFYGIEDQIFDLFNE